MSVSGEYMGMPLSIEEFDGENLGYFRFCAEHDFRLQHCSACDLVRYPPTTACPWCANPDWDWRPVDTKGIVHSYSEIHHAIQPAFRDHLPYLVLLVELDAQSGKPTQDEGIRIIGNLVTEDGVLAPEEVVQGVGIGTRVCMTFSDVAEGLAIPQWILDETADQPEKPWRYPQE